MNRDSLSSYSVMFSFVVCDGSMYDITANYLANNVLFNNLIGKRQ